MHGFDGGVLVSCEEGHEGQMVMGLDIEQRWCTGRGGGDEWG